MLLSARYRSPPAVVCTSGVPIGSRII
jgi:hypothetical protein